jgi:hypothetical protein
MSKINEIGDLGDRMMQGLPYGQGGAIAGAVEPGVLDTFSSPDVVQDLNKFGTMVDKSNLTAKQTQANISPFAPYNGKDPWDYVKDVEQIKYKVTPDEIIMGIDYEMKKLVLKDKQVAKQNVVNNLKNDHQYYSKLHMLDIEDGEEEKKSEEITDYRTPQEKAIAEIMRDLHEKKKQRRNWS